MTHSSSEKTKPFQRKPDWFRVPANSGRENEAVMAILRELDLHTVCEEANCPNCGECFGRRTATFMILGNQCTRQCQFCAVSKGTPLPVDPDEPAHIASAVSRLGLKHVVITSVTRDDLPDGGSAQFAAVIREIRRNAEPNAPTIEVLIPDFQGNQIALETVLQAEPDVLNHNIETVPRLYQSVRPQAEYARSLALLRRARQIHPSLLLKSGIMVGLGETPSEVAATMRDLRIAGCDLLTVGQYLAPSKQHHPVVEYVHPDQFEQYKKEALAMG